MLANRREVNVVLWCLSPYVRMVLVTLESDETFLCLDSPCWINNQANPLIRALMINSSMHNLCVCCEHTLLFLSEPATHTAEECREGERGWRTRPPSIHCQRSLCPLFVSDWSPPQRGRGEVGGVWACEKTDTLKREETEERREDLKRRRKEGPAPLLCSSEREQHLHMLLLSAVTDLLLPAAGEDAGVWRWRDDWFVCERVCAGCKQNLSRPAAVERQTNSLLSSGGRRADLWTWAESLLIVVGIISSSSCLSGLTRLSVLTETHSCGVFADFSSSFGTFWGSDSAGAGTLPTSLPPSKPTEAPFSSLNSVASRPWIMEAPLD